MTTATLPAREPGETLVSLQCDATIAEMIRIEPAILDLLEVAAAVIPAMDKRALYETLKGVGKRYVGHGARNPVLATCRHYEAMMRAIGALLPETEGESCLN